MPKESKVLKYKLTVGELVIILLCIVVTIAALFTSVFLLFKIITSNPWMIVVLPIMVCLIPIGKMRRILHLTKHQFSSRDYTQPPQRAKLLIQLLPIKYGGTLEDDLQEDYEFFKADHGEKKAYYFYWWQAIAAWIEPVVKCGIAGGVAAAIRKIIGGWW